MLVSGTPAETKRLPLNRLIWRIFTKKHGITLQQDAVDFLTSKLAGEDDEAVDLEVVGELIEYVAMMFSRQDNKPDLVDRLTLQIAVDGILKSANRKNDFGAVNVRDYIHVISAYETARWDYDPHTKTFFLYTFGLG